MIFHENSLLAILMKYQFLFRSKIRKDVAKSVVCCSCDWRFKVNIKFTGVVTVHDSQSGNPELGRKCSEITNIMFKRTKHPKKAISLCLSYCKYLIKNHDRF